MVEKRMIFYNPIYRDNKQHDSNIFFNDLLNALNSELSGEPDDDESFQIKYQNCMIKSKVNQYDCGEKIIDYQE